MGYGQREASGIGKSGQTWDATVRKHREQNPCCCTFPENVGKYCIFHGFALNGGKGGKIHSTPAADKLIESRCLEYNELGHILPSTARGRRRQERLKKGR